MNAILRRRRSGGSGLGPYLANNVPSAGVLDFARSVYSGVDGRVYDPEEIITYSDGSTKTMVNASGVLVTVPQGTPRLNSHLYDGTSWVNNGLLLESEARTQLLHTTDALVTQSHTVTAVPHTLHFTGTGTVTLSGASTAGPLVGTGTGEQNRVSLTFTPSAASLTLTVSGTVSDAQLEVGATPSSYIPNLAASGTVTRAAETLELTAAKNPVLTHGPELVTNGTFDTDTADWVGNNANATLTWQAGGTAVFENTVDYAYVKSSATIELPIGTYEVSFNIVDLSLVTGSLHIGLGSSGSPNYTTSGQKSYIYVSDGTAKEFQIRPNGTGTGTIEIDNISVKSLSMPTALSIAMKGTMTYADGSNPVESEFVRWDAGTEEIVNYLNTSGGNTGQVWFRQVDSGGTIDTTTSSTTAYSPGTNVPFNIASAHTTGRINGAVDGTALTEDATPTALPDLSATDMDIGYDFMGHISRLALYSADVTDDGLEEITT